MPTLEDALERIEALVATLRAEERLELDGNDDLPSSSNSESDPATGDDGCGDDSSPRETDTEQPLPTVAVPRTFPCPHCAKTYKSRQSRHRHVRSRHTHVARVVRLRKDGTPARPPSPTTTSTTDLYGNIF